LPIIERGLVDDLSPGSEIAPCMRAGALTGHEPGHIGLWIGDDAL
jgi:hypothetical protein